MTYHWLREFLVSKWFFYSIVLLFAAEASWLAITSAFQMAFDESFHFQSIQFWSHHLSPIVLHQSPDTYGLGNLVHNPSWLYHYLFSFPYRLLLLMTNDIRTQVVILRLLNVAMGVVSLIILRKTLKSIRIHSGIANIILCLFALTPVVTALSAQINYDNLLLLAVITASYLTIRCLQQIKDNNINSRMILGLFAVCLFGSLVKYSFLPVLVGVAILLVWAVSRQFKNRRVLWQSFAASFRELHISGKVALISLCVIGSGLFAAFYGVNLVRYHNLSPQCNQVLSVTACSHYYAWNRNYTLAQNRASAPPQLDIVHYAVLWIKTTWYQLYAEIIPTGGLVPIAKGFYFSLLALTATAGAATLLQLKQIAKSHPQLFALGAISLTYVLALWMRNYHDYVNLGEPVAIQGRYFVPVLAYYYAFLTLGVSYALRGHNAVLKFGKLTAATAAVTIFVTFGGYIRYAAEVTPGHSWANTEQAIDSVSH